MRCLRRRTYLFSSFVVSQLIPHIPYLYCFIICNFCAGFRMSSAAKFYLRALVVFIAVQGQLGQIPFQSPYPFQGQFPIQAQYPFQSQYPIQFPFPIQGQAAQMPIQGQDPFQGQVVFPEQPPEATTSPATCRYWCRWPGALRQFYCCPMGELDVRPQAIGKMVFVVTEILNLTVK